MEHIDAVVFSSLFIYGVILSLNCRFGDDIVDSNEVNFVSTQECKPFRLDGSKNQNPYK